MIDETKVQLDFHIYAILEFDLLIGCPSEKKTFPKETYSWEPW
jgi:hypothetical protein